MAKAKKSKKPSRRALNKHEAEIIRVIEKAKSPLGDREVDTALASCARGLASKIEEYRRKRGLSLKVMAHLVGIDPSSMHLIASGDVGRFTFDRILRCAKHLNDPKINKALAKIEKSLKS